MFVPVMRIREVPMRVRHRLVPVWVSVRGAALHAGMLVLMMSVVLVLVIMLQRLVTMRVLVPLGQMQPHTTGH